MSTAPPGLAFELRELRSELERVKGYIYGQRQHHREHSFEQELRALCGREPADTAALEKFLRREPRRGGTH